MRSAKYKIKLSEEEKKELEQLTRKHSTAQNIAQRAKIILMANEKIRNVEISHQLGIMADKITKWTKRWVEIEGSVKERLSDKQRSGRPAEITAQQWCEIMALACEKPENYGLPISHWSHSTLTKEILKQGIVESISQSHVGEFLKKQNYNPIEVSIGSMPNPMKKKKRE